MDTLFKDVFKFQTILVETTDDVNKYVREKDLAGEYIGLGPDEKKVQLCFGVTFNSTASNKWEYNLHYNVTGQRQYKDVYGFHRTQDRVTQFQ